MGALTLSSKPKGALILDTLPEGLLALTGTEALLAVSTAPRGVINVPDFSFAAGVPLSALIDEYGEYLLDENGNPLLWQ